MDYQEADDSLFDLFMREGGSVTSKIGSTKFPESLRALVTLHVKLNAIKNGMSEMIDSDNPYAYNALYRCLLDHFLKFTYIFFRLLNEKSDGVGSEYYSFLGAKEALDYADAIQLGQQIIGREVTYSPEKVLERLYPKAAKLTQHQLNSISSKWKYRRIIKYIRTGFPSIVSESNPLLASIIPDFSLLSSFVHGGPYAELEMQSYATPKAIEECHKQQKIAVLIVGASIQQCAIAAGLEFPECLPLASKAKAIMDQLAAADRNSENT